MHAAIAFLQHCKRIYSNANDMEYITQLLAMLQAAQWTPEAHGAVVNALAYMYCYRTDMGTDTLCSVTSTLADVFDMDANLDVLHLQTQQQLDGWIAQLQQLQQQ